jgi:ABC-2 type transport system permease protein
MKATWMIAKKDMRSLLVSPLFYIIAGICTLFWSGKFIKDINSFASRSMMASFQGGENGGGPNITYEVFASHISFVNFICILAVAGFTMRLFSEEKRNRTFDLLLTSPVTSTQITLGKFIGGLMVAWSLVAMAVIYPLLVAPITTVDWGPVAAAFIGLFLTVGCYVAVGTMMSSFTSHPVLAVIFALIGNVMLWFVGMFLEDGEGPFWTGVKEQMTLGSHFTNFMKGSINLSSIVYFISVMFICVFITQRVVESHRWR